MFIVAGLALAGTAGYGLATWSVFDPTSIGVEGNRHVPADEILAGMAIPKDRNVWLFDKKAAERRVAALPWIKTASIHRSLPAKVRVVVTEREPVACVEAAAARYLVDETGRVIETDCPSAGLPVFGWPDLPGQTAGAMLDDVARLRRMVGDASVLADAKLGLRRLDFDRFDGLEAWLQDGPLVRFGDDRDLAQKARLVDPILRTYGVRARDLAVIDLRAPASPVVEGRKRPKV